MHGIERQIFVGGCSRSGTTLLGSILGAHSDCVCTPESHFKISVLRSCRTDDGDVDLDEALGLIRIHWRFKLWEVDVDPPQAPRSSYPELLSWLVGAYVRETQGERSTQPHTWVDHTPENLNYAPLLLELFPHAKIVHIVRDGRAVANSIMPLDWGPNTIIRAAPWWETTVQEGLALESSLPGAQIVRVTYEELVHSPEETVRWLCQRLDLDYEPGMVQADGFQPPDYTSSQHGLIGKRPSPERAHVWKLSLTGRQVEIFESLAGGLLGQMGYELVYGPSARPPTTWERAGAALKEFVRGEVINGLRWLVRSYPLWLSWDFVRLLPDTWFSYQKADVE